MKKRRILITVLVILLMILVSLGAYVFFFMEPKENLSTMYLSSDTNVQYVLDEELNEVSFVRGTEVSLSDRIKKIDDKLEELDKQDIEKQKEDKAKIIDIDKYIKKIDSKIEELEQDK